MNIGAMKNGAAAGGTVALPSAGHRAATGRTCENVNNTMGRIPPAATITKPDKLLGVP